MKCTNKNTYVSTDAEAKGIVSIILNFLVIFMPITLAKRIVRVMLIAAGLPVSRIVEKTNLTERSIRAIGERMFSIQRSKTSHHNHRAKHKQAPDGLQE